MWNALGLKSKGCWFEPTMRHYFSSNIGRFLAYVFTGEDNQNDRSMTNQIEYTGLRQDSYLLVYF